MYKSRYKQLMPAPGFRVYSFHPVDPEHPEEAEFVCEYPTIGWAICEISKSANPEETWTVIDLVILNDEIPERLGELLENSKDASVLLLSPGEELTDEIKKTHFGLALIIARRHRDELKKRDEKIRQLISEGKTDSQIEFSLKISHFLVKRIRDAEQVPPVSER